MDSEDKKPIYVHRVSDNVRIDSQDEYPSSVDKHTMIPYKKLVVPSAMRSIYWKCYGFPASENNEILTRNKIVCLLCKSQMIYNRNTSNLRMHLQNKHKSELATLELIQPLPSCKSGQTDRRSIKRQRKSIKQEVASPNSSSVVQVFPVANSNENTTMPEITATTPSQSYVATEIDEMNPLRVIVKEATANQTYTLVDGKIIADAIAEFIILDLQMPDIVEGKGFQRLIATLKSPCEIPSKSRLMDEMVPRIYDTVKDHLHLQISSLTCDISLSVEDWVSASGDTYSTISIHYIQPNNDFELQSKVLSTIYCSEVDALHWGAQFDSTMDEWEVKLDKVKAIIVSSEREEVFDSLLARSFIVVPCLSHTLQTACTKAVFERPEVIEVLQKCRALISLINRNPTVLANLKVQENVIQLEESTLTTDISSSWVTTFNMVEQIHVRRHILSPIIESLSTSVCPTTSLEFTESQWEIIEDVVAVLSPFKVTAVTLNEETSPLISILKPIMWQLMNVHLVRAENDSEFLATTKASLSEILVNKYRETKVSDILELATSLDPRFKNLPFWSDQDKPILKKKLKELLFQHIESTQTDETSKETFKKPRLSGMEFLLGDLCVAKSEMPASQRAELELVQYNCESVASLEKSPIEWWKEMGGKCTQLSKLAFQFLCIPVSLSRNNLSPGLYPNLTLQNLSPQFAQKLKFLHHNYVPQ